MSSWKPTGYPSMSPYLICNDAQRLIDFVQSAFGAVVLRKFNRPDGSLLHVEVRIDDSVLMIGGGGTDARASLPHIHLYVSDASAVFDRAVAVLE
jgi:PhnB protein